MAHDHYYLNNSKASQDNCLRPRILYTGTVKDDPFWFNLEHKHDFCEILYVLSGEGTVILDDVHHVVREGDLVIVNPRLRHEEKSHSEKPLNFVFLGIDNFSLPGLPENNLLPSYKTAIIPSRKYRYRIESLFSAIISESIAQLEYSIDICQNLVSTLLIMILRITMTAPDNTELMTDECKRVKEYIDQNYTSPITLESLSEIVYISKHHLAHVFKVQTGVSPIKYMITKRIFEACRLLVETNYSVSEIAKMVGYDDPLYFSQIFKRVKLVSPSEFRKENS